MRWLVLILCLLLQLTWSDLLAIQGRAPDLLLLGVIWVSMSLAPWQGALLGLLAGLGLDAVGALDPLGAGALAAVSAGFFAARFLGTERRLHPVLLLGRCALLLAPLELFLANLRYRGMDYDPGQVSLWLALPVWAYTLVLFQLLNWLPGTGARSRGGLR